MFTREVHPSQSLELVVSHWLTHRKVHEALEIAFESSEQVCSFHIDIDVLQI